jgi:hypothetical protein
MSDSLEDILKKRFNRFDFMRHILGGQRSINKAEEASLISLLGYVAMDTGVPLDDLQQDFLGHFNVNRLEHLRADDYDDAVRFLIDWKSAADEHGEHKIAG